MICNEELYVKWLDFGAGVPRVPDVWFPNVNYIEGFSKIGFGVGAREFASMSLKRLLEPLEFHMDGFQQGVAHLMIKFWSWSSRGFRLMSFK